MHNKLTLQNKHLLEKLTSGVAHEVRNPLNALMTISEALFKKLDNDAAYGQYMSHIRNQIKRISRLMEDLVTFGKPLQKEHCTIVKASDLLNDSISEWVHNAPDRSKKVLLDIPELSETLFIDADIASMRQAIIIVLDNAECSMPPDGTISIFVTKPEKAFLNITFRYSDSLITVEDLEHIFDPFSITKRTGTGLGMSIFKKNIENHGGIVCASISTAPPGVSIDVQLPITAQSNQNHRIFS